MSSPENPISLRALAKQIGLSKSTVSLALRGNPKIPEATRKRVEAAARDYGYRPSAAMSAAMSAAGSGGKNAYRETVACLAPGLPLNQISKAQNQPQRLAISSGIRQTAEEAGCDLDFLSLDNISGSRLRRILRTRGIRRILIVLGILRPGNFAQLQELAEEFPVVFVGYPEIHSCPGVVVRPDYFTAGQQAFFQGWKAGYRKFVLNPLPILLNPDRRFEAGFRFAAQLFQTKSSVDITTEPWPPAVDLDRLKRTTDAETCYVGGMSPDYYAELFEILKEPSAPGFLDWHANLYREEWPLSGIDQREVQQGAEALELCLRLPLTSGGKASVGVHLVEPVWIDGESLPQRRVDHLNLAKESRFRQVKDEVHQPINLTNSSVSSPVQTKSWAPDTPPPAVPAGNWRFHGVPFSVPESRGFAPIFLAARQKRVSAEIPLGIRASALYFLHGCADYPEPGEIAVYRIRFEDGKELSLPLVHPKLRSHQIPPEKKPNISDWWPDHPHFNAGNVRSICLMDIERRLGQMGYYYILRWNLPRSGKKIERLRVDLQPGPQGVLFLFGLTAATLDDPK